MIVIKDISAPRHKIATLGPQGTFSEIATQRYLKEHSLDFDITYYNTINQSLKAIGTDTHFGMLPIENFSEGFVNPVLDYLVNADLHICAELRLPIQFSLVSHCENLDDVESIYVQFVAKGQCAEYLEKLDHVSLITTDSNTQSLLSLSDSTKSAAVIPSHLLAEHNFSSVVENITDYKNNQTRFLLFADKPCSQFNGRNHDYKTSIIVLFHEDYPGYLEGVLKKFTEKEINLTSIVSRPTRRTFGKYHFFIDLDGHQQDPMLQSALADVQSNFKVKILGSYLKS